jgi:hypothetical protein
MTEQASVCCAEEAPAADRKKQLLTHSRLSCFRACPRRHQLRYEFGLVPTQDDSVLRVGSGFHAALEANDLDLDPDEAIGERIEDPFEMAMVAAMFNGHLSRWAGDRLRAVSTELEFSLPLRNPATGRPTQVWTLAGKIDRIVELSGGRLALMEYKTTSQDFSPGAEYWLKLHMDQQLSIYVIAARSLGWNVETVLYDVTRRPMLRPYKATPEAVRKYTKDGRLYANQRDTDETPEEYAARIAEDIASRPEHYFARIEIARLDRDLEECAAELWNQQLAIREMQRARRWYRNPGSCFSIRPCEYLNICLNDDLDERTPEGFIRLEDQHPELSGSATLAG